MVVAVGINPVISTKDTTGVQVKASLNDTSNCTNVELFWMLDHIIYPDSCK